VLGKGMSGVVREVNNFDLLDESHCSFSTIKTSLSTNYSNAGENNSQTESENDSERETECLNDRITSRSILASLCKRNGESRYAVKTLMVEDASAEQQARARIDLAIEVNYLKVLSHPHTDPFHPKFFILMDRLYGTLYDKINEWEQSLGRKKIDVMKTVLKRLRSLRSRESDSWKREFMKERLFVAHDIASAIKYLHDNKVVHR
jgi:serine/threonine protein kinase